MRKPLLIIGLIWGIAALGWSDVNGQTAALRGFITDAANGESLQGVNVALKDASGRLYGAVSNGDGIYAITRLDPGNFTLQITFVGYIPYRDTLSLTTNERQTLNVALEVDETELGELVVESEREGGATLSGGLQTVRPQDIEMVPTPDVAGDLASYLTTLPGVVAVGDRGGQLFIRGGEPSHTMVLLDGMYVYQPFHMLGFYSAFPSEIINRADIHAAGYGSPFSGRISSVIDIHTRNGNKKQFTGSASVAPFVSALRLEGPIVKNNVSFIASVRESVVEELAEQYLSQDLPYNFGDVFGKVHAVLNENHRLSFSGLYTHDRGRLGTPSEDKTLDEVSWNNRALGFRYVFIPESIPFVGEIKLSQSRLRAELGPEGRPVRLSEIENFNYEVNITNFIGRTEWKWGLFWRAPQIISIIGGIYQNIDFGFGRRHKAGIYLEPNLYITQNFHARLGLIAQRFPGQNQESIIEPRMQLAYKWGLHEFNVSAGLYHQEVVGLTDRRDATNVFTAWRSAPTDKLTKARHASLGYRITHSAGIQLSAEGYYKDLENLFIAEWTSFPRFTTRLQRADGIVKGVDLRMEFRRSTYYAMLNYGLSSVEYEAQQPSLNLWFGDDRLKFNPPHDRRHQINALISTSIKGFDVRMNWNFGSGRPFNRVFGFDGFVLQDGVQDLFNVQDDQRVIYERPFRGRLPTYHRMDLSIGRPFQMSGYDLTFQAGIINMYNRKNLFALDLFTLRRTDQLPFTPTFGIKMDLNP